MKFLVLVHLLFVYLCVYPVAHFICLSKQNMFYLVNPVSLCIQVFHYILPLDIKKDDTVAILGFDVYFGISPWT
ncbi:uncharacterized protein BYT42DRAFT_575333 [Radiomyces spectabilis]|uniref:uncharacterized protein n=1 Tax=Radiomyces spectabilis TaxID=64574 RepID=UPI00222037AD|nr:uncharacterized protein BYT42DRAFT_575333 [Radiomyces spectabilis]KAI8374172.1 hypothetical protein BYT42DRAFT_575333 [Radiomyces spectabilis]